MVFDSLNSAPIMTAGTCHQPVLKGVETSPPCYTLSTVWLTSMPAPLKSESLASSQLNGHGNTSRWLASSERMFLAIASSSWEDTAQWTGAGEHPTTVWLPWQSGPINMLIGGTKRRWLPAPITLHQCNQQEPFLFSFVWYEWFFSPVGYLSYMETLKINSPKLPQIFIPSLFLVYS